MKMKLTIKELIHLSHNIGDIKIGHDNDDDDNTDQEELTNKTSMIFQEMFNEFTYKTSKLAKKYKTFEHNPYPKKHRFCIFIDRRKSLSNNDTTDEVIFFEPPNDCNEIPDDPYTQLWFFDSSQTCIIPNTLYGNKSNLISSGSTDTGKLMILSFHVISPDENRCYLYLNGGMTRFFPQDIIDILPLFFEQTNENKIFKNSKTAQNMVNQMNDKLIDLRFEAFYDKYGNGKIIQRTHIKSVRELKMNKQIAQ
eukprot:270844_1